jgi:hypothetical protein
MLEAALKWVKHRVGSVDEIFVSTDENFVGQHARWPAFPVGDQQCLLVR